MSDIGPELPPHLLAKRKRKEEENVQSEPTTASGAKGSLSPGDGEKRRRVLGPAMPPASLDERPDEPANVSNEPDSDDDDGFGPSLPSMATPETAKGNDESKAGAQESAAAEVKPRRDEWMMMPPKQDDLAARLDPTKQRARGFNTGKGARGPNSAEEDGSVWHETPEQKQKRLADAMMGVSKLPSTGPPKPAKSADTGRSEAAAQKVREHTEKTCGTSLLDQHSKTKGAEAEDDPSKRAFDRDKDMGSGMRIGHAQRKELLNKASNFSSKFAGGGYL